MNWTNVQIFLLTLVSFHETILYEDYLFNVGIIYEIMEREVICSYINTPEIFGNTDSNTGNWTIYSLLYIVKLKNLKMKFNKIL